jgi:Clp amino terminal domain, pathogenicity island component
MFEQFTNETRRIVIAAQEHARAQRHDYIGTAHLLLALTDDQTGPVAQAFSALDVPVAALRARLTDSNAPGTQQPPDRIPFTPRCKTALTHSYAEALRTSQSVDVATLGVGLTLVDGGAAAQTLRHFGLTPARLRDQLTSLRTPSTPAPAAVPTAERRRGHRPRDATELAADQLAMVSVAFLEDRDGQALVRLPNGSHTTVAYTTLTPVPDTDLTTPWSSVFGIRLQFLGNHDGQALVRLPDQTQTVIDYTALTIRDDPIITGRPDGPRVVSCPSCDWFDCADSLQDAMDAFNTHHAQRHPDRHL